MTDARQSPSWVMWAGLGIGVLGVAACIAGIWLWPGLFFRSYLVAYHFWLGIALGSLAFVMIYHLTGGGWGLLLRRVLESGTRTLPLLGLLFLPLLFGMDYLYEWSRPEAATELHLEEKIAYLNMPWFVVRAVLYFLIWIGIAYFLNRWSREHDRTADPSLLARMRTLSAPGLVLYGLAVTFASVDWIMSLQPHWYSTIFGVVYGMAQLLAALAFAIAVLYLLAPYPPFSELISPKYSRDLGNLLLTLVIFWMYVAFSQFFLIWNGNLPEEVIWYLPRIQGGWEWVAGLLVAFQFVLPFLLLLFRGVKNRLRHLARVSVLILVMYLVNLFWQIMPAFPASVFPAHWLEAAGTTVAFLAIGGLWTAMFVWQLGRMPLVPPHDPMRQEVAPHG